jgi:hypothetical protein
MRTPIYILPLCLCCFPVLGQQQSGDSVLKTNATQSHRVYQSNDPMVEKYKQHEGWVKLTEAINRQNVIAANLRSQIRAQNEVIQAKTHAKKDASTDRARLNQLQKSLAPVSSSLGKMVTQRNLIESEIRMRDINKK